MGLRPPLLIPRLPGPIDVTWAVPGSKSITNRALILAALADGETRLTGALESDDTRLYVPETGHSVSGGFRAFYDRHGSAVLGSPLTEELSEDGFTVQYFERMVLEYLPGKPVQASLLGDDLLREKGWLR